MIAAAKRFIYFENQYFTCGKIAAAIAERLSEDDPPEFVMVMPETADGWLEQMAMDAARVQLVREIAKAKRSEEHTSELQSLMRISYAVFCLKKKKTIRTRQHEIKKS